VTNRKRKKEREKRFVELFKEAHTGFPPGELIEDENQEKPDVVAVTSEGKIGIEVTSLHIDELKREESESEQVVAEARRIYEMRSLPALFVSVHAGKRSNFNRKNRGDFANAIAALVSANIPPEGKSIQLDNDWDDPKGFPFAIDCIHIFRYSWPDDNSWSAPSAGMYREKFIDELQSVITKKELKLKDYAQDCKQQWLLVVAENESPSTYFDPSETTINHCYKSSFDKVFLFKPIQARVFDLKLSKEA
jgi:hypothetical protein